jgi:hypothetical protein
MQRSIRILLFHVYISSICFGRHTAPHQEPKTAGHLLVFYTWKVDGRVFGRRQAQYVPDNVHQLHVHQPSTYEKPEAASAVLGS